MTGQGGTGLATLLADNILLNRDFLLATAGLVFALLAGAISLSILDRWRKRQMSESQESAEALTSFRALYENGELSQEEYQAIRYKMAAKIKADDKLSGGPTVELKRVNQAQVPNDPSDRVNSSDDRGDSGPSEVDRPENQ